MTNLQLLQRRKSVRSYSDKRLADSLKNRLRSEATYSDSHEAGLSFRVCFHDDAPFKGIGRSYGMFHNVHNYLAVVEDPTFPDTSERAGFCAQRFVIEAESLGIATCFVGGTFSSAHVATEIEVYEKIPFLVAFGYADEKRNPFIARMALKMAHRHERSARDFYDGDDEEYAHARKVLPWLDNALEAVACAPSALNRQPVRLKLSEMDGVPTVEAHTLVPSRDAIELGIAKFNVEFAVGGVWDWGEKAPFVPD